MKKRPVQLVWFKRDLRVTDHACLAQAAARGPVLPLYIIEPDFWGEPDTSARHWTFLRQSLDELRAALAHLGQPLLIRQGNAVAVLEHLSQEWPLAALWSHQETGNDWTYARDKRVAAWCISKGLPWHQPRQFGVIRKLTSRDGWAGEWQRQMSYPCHATPHLEPIYSVPDFDLPKPEDLGLEQDGGDQIQTGGSNAARALLHSFLTTRGAPYRAAMSSPLAGADACSRLSPHLTFGTISLREVAQAAARRAEDLPKGPSHINWRGSLRAFQSRLYWHCHFIQKLEDEPRIEWANMHAAYDGLRDDPRGHPWFDAWKEGQTGLPFLDACMRSLRHTGWLNFRMRAMVMAVASYHMWFHWRETGLHLARMFTDYEPGIHWSQVQMQSGTTGINTIRVYNPIKQGLDQDPDGLFIRTWIPELEQLSGDALHRPWLHPAAQGILGRTYPAPIFDPAARAKWAKDQIWEKRRAPDHKVGAVAVLSRHGSRKSPRKTRRATKHSSTQLSLFD